MTYYIYLDIFGIVIKGKWQVLIMPHVNLSEKLIIDIRKLGRKFAVDKIVLFGSRARGDNQPSSDIDIAVFTLPQFTSEGIFVSELEELDTLLKIDVVFIESSCEQHQLIEKIKEEGVVLYERLSAKT